MSFATTKFQFPFEPGEPIMFPVSTFSYKQNYDKYYILDGKEFMSRYEVAHTAVKHGIMISTQETIPMSRKSAYVSYRDPLRHSEFSINLKPPPAYFGMWLGRFIPILRDFNNLRERFGIDGYTPRDVDRLATAWTNEFFEDTTEFWMEMLMGNDHNRELTNYARVGKPVWVQWNMSMMWIPVYQTLTNQGLISNPMLESLIDSIKDHIPEEVQP